MESTLERRPVSMAARPLSLCQKKEKARGSLKHMGRNLGPNLGDLAASSDEFEHVGHAPCVASCVNLVRYCVV